MEQNYDPEKLTNDIRNLSLKTGAELVGFASAEKMDKDAPKGHKPSNLLRNPKSLIILACGRKLNEDREYDYEWGPHYAKTYIKLKEEVKEHRKQARGCIEAVKKFLIEKGF